MQVYRLHVSRLRVSRFYKTMSNIIAQINGIVLYLLSALTYRTCRLQISGIDNFEEALDKDKPFIITSWHGMTMMVAAFICQKHDMSTFIGLTPDDWRGQILMVFAKLLGAEPYSMNLDGDSSLKMGRELIRFIRKISGGKNLVLHPDGPAGPAYVVKPGLSFIAKKTGATIVPMGTYCRHAYRVPRWDTYVLPFPFSRITIHIGEPLTISKETKDLAETNQHITNILHRMAAQATANYYEQQGDK